MRKARILDRAWPLFSPTVLRVMRRAWLVLFLIACLVFVGRYLIDQSGRLDALLHVSVPALITAGVLQVAFWYAVSLFWCSIVNVVSHRKIPLLHSLAHFALLSLGKYLPGKVWGMVARGAHLRRHGVEPREALAATVHEQVVLLHAGAVLSAFLLAVLTRTAWAWGLAVAALASIIAAVSLQKTAAAILAAVSGRLGGGSAGSRALALRPRTYAALLSAYILIWVLNGTVLAQLHLAFFGGPLTVTLVLTLVLANTVGIITGFLAVFAPGGIGVRESVTSALLVGVMPIDQAVLLNLLYRLWLVVGDLLLGAGLLLFLRQGLVEPEAEPTERLDQP